MKRVLLVSYFAPPALNAESILVWKTIKELSRSHAMTVLMTAGDGHFQRDDTLKLPSTVQVCNKPALMPSSRIFSKVSEKSIGFLADEHILWSLCTNRFARQFIDHDVIYSRSQPGASHILALSLKRKLRKPWIAQFSDPWANNPYHTSHTRLRHAVDKFYESRVVREADALVFPTIEIQSMYVNSYPDVNIAQKSSVLPHHYIPELYGDRNDKESAHLMRVTYFGDFYGARSPEPFIAALHTLSESNAKVLEEMEAAFVGNVEAKFQPVLDTAPIPIQRAKMSYFESLQAMRHSNVLLLVDAKSTDGVNPFMPSKLIDYLGAGRPILGVTNERGTTANILREHGHRVVDPANIQGIAHALEEMVQIKCQPSHPPAAFTTEHVIGELSRLIAIM